MVGLRITVVWSKHVAVEHNDVLISALISCVDGVKYHSLFQNQIVSTECNVGLPQCADSDQSRISFAVNPRWTDGSTKN